MADAAGHDIAAGQKFFEGQIFIAIAQQFDRADRKVKLPALHQGLQLGRITVALIDADLRMRLLKLGDHARDQRIGEKRCPADPYGATFTSAKGVSGLGTATRGQSDDIALLGQNAAEFRGLQRSPVSQDQRFAKARLKRRQHPADRWLAGSKQRRCLCQAACFDNGGKLHQVAWIDDHISLI